MHQIPILSAIFQGIPEAISLVFLSFVLLKTTIEWKWLLILGVFHVTIAFVLRLLSLAFGVHTILLIIILSSLIALFIKIDFFRIITAVLISFTLLLIFEFISFKYFMPLLNLKLEEVLVNPTLRILMGIPQIFFMFLTGMIIMFIRKV